MKLARSVALGLVAASVAAPSASAHGRYVPVSRVASSWSPEPAVLVPAAVVFVLFAQAFVRLRRRGRADLAPASRAAIFFVAVAVGTLALVSPLDKSGEEYLLSAHMLQHVIIGDLAPALALVALRGPLLFFFIPPLVLAPLARLRPLRAALAWVLRPTVAVAAWAVVFGVWHVPALYDATLAHQWLHDLEHALFVLVGLCAWTQIVDPARHGKPTVPRRIAIAVGVFAAGQILAYVLIFSFHALYATYANRPERLFGWSPLLDQQLAGLVMMVEQLLTYGTAVGILLWGTQRARERARVSAGTARGSRAPQ